MKINRSGKAADGVVGCREMFLVRNISEHKNEGRFAPENISDINIVDSVGKK